MAQQKVTVSAAHDGVDTSGYRFVVNEEIIETKVVAELVDGRISFDYTAETDVDYVYRIDPYRMVVFISTLVAVTDLQVDVEPPPIDIEPPPTSGEAHEWFEYMRGQPSCLGSLTLRDQDEIDAATPKAPNALYRYLHPNDDHPDACDACKYTLPALKEDGSCQPSQPTNQKIELPLKVSERGAIVIVAWDFFYTEDWKYAFTAQGDEDWNGYKFKTFQLTHPADKIYFESRNLWGKARGEEYVSVLDVRSYDMGEMQQVWGVYEPTGYMPTGERAIPNFNADGGNPGGLDIPWGQWLRYYMEFQLGVPADAFTSWNRWRPTINGQPIEGTSKVWPDWTGPIPPGTLNMLSHYVAGETFDPVCVLDRVPAFYKEGQDIGKFYFEMNTSSSNTRHGDAIAYARNIVAWRAEQSLADDPSPLARPLR